MGNPKKYPRKIVSGGQTGVDRAALDAATACGLPTGGWCPGGRLAEDGVIDRRYPLRQTPSPDPAQRTAWNVRDSDATLVLLFDQPAGGTALTIDEAHAQGKPLRLVSLTRHPEANDVAAWIEAHGIEVLNVAGPRESEAPGVYAAARALLAAIFGHDRRAVAHEGVE